MPECVWVVINQGTDIRTFRWIAVGRRHLIGRSNRWCSDKVLCSCHSCKDFSTECIVLSNQEVVVLDEFELFKELLYFFIRNFLEIPFAGILVSCSICIEGFNPEAQFLVRTAIYAIVTPRRAIICNRSMIHLMDKSIVKEFLAGKTDSEDVPIVRFSVGEDFVFVCIVEDYTAGIFCIRSHGKLVVGLIGARTADVCFHTCILDKDAITALFEFPDVVGQISSDGTIYSLVFMIRAEGSCHSLIHEATLVVCGFVAVVSDDAIVTVAIRKRIRSYTVQNSLIQRVEFCFQSIKRL